MEFTPFFFDGNVWFGLVDSPGRWRELVSAYEGYLEKLLDAKKASMENLRALPWAYHLGAPGVKTGEVPCFGFRREHIDGTMTLGEWAQGAGMDLRAIAADSTED